MSSPRCFDTAARPVRLVQINQGLTGKFCEVGGRQDGLGESHGLEETRKAKNPFAADSAQNMQQKRVGLNLPPDATRLENKRARNRRHRAIIKI